MADQLELVLETMLGLATRADESRRAHVVADFALLSLLIDTKIATADQICQPIDAIVRGMPDEYQAPGVMRRLEHGKQWLRHYERAPTERWAPSKGLDQPIAPEPKE
jgi:hypothetical protein